MQLFLIAFTVASSTILGNTLYDIIKMKREATKTIYLRPSEIKDYQAERTDINDQFITQPLSKIQVAELIAKNFDTYCSATQERIKTKCGGNPPTEVLKAMVEKTSERILKSSTESRLKFESEKQLDAYIVYSTVLDYRVGKVRFERKAIKKAAKKNAAE